MCLCVLSPDVAKLSWAAVKAAQMARNATGGGGSGGTKAIPDGEPNCLAGLTFVFTGELPSFSREEAQDAAKRFGGYVTGILLYPYG